MREEEDQLIRDLKITSDLVNHPDHYKGKGIECIDVIEAFDLNFCLGNSIKYILRCDNKGDREQDLRKAIWYLQRELRIITDK